MLFEYSDENVYIRHAIDESPNDNEFNMHIHEQCEIYFFVAGSVEYLVEGSKYLLEENSIMIMQPAEAHRARIINPAKYERYAINFPINYLERIDPEGQIIATFLDRPLGKNNLFTVNDLDTLFIKNLLSQICETKKEYTTRLAINTHLPFILDMLYRASKKRSFEENAPVSVPERMVEYVNSHLFEELSIPMLANCFYLSPSQFSRIFKAATGSSPWNYITRKRLTFAREKLHEGLSAREACELTGFADYSSFYRAYTKYFGAPPKQSK